MEFFLKVTLDRYWNYQGKYFFISNHCGTETKNQLLAVTPSKASKIRSVPPRKIYNTLEDSPWVDDSLHARITHSNTASVYYFPSKKPLYQATLDSLQHRGIFSNRSLEDVLNKINANERATVYEELFAGSGYNTWVTSEKRRVLIDLLFLERFIQTRERKKLTEEIVVRLVKEDSELIHSITETLERLYREPWSLVQDGRYGVPHEHALNEYLAGHSEREQQHMEIESLLRGYAPLAKQMAAMEQLIKLEQALTTELRRLR